MSTKEPKKDYFFTALAALCWIVAVIGIFLGIWVDPRWGWTSIALGFVGLACAAISRELDKKYEREGRAE